MSFAMSADWRGPRERAPVRLHADAVLPDARGSPEAAAKVRVVAVEGLDVHVTEQRMLDPRLDALDELLLVDVAETRYGCPDGAFCAIPVTT